MPYVNRPYVDQRTNTIADLLLRSGDIEARRAEQIGNAQARGEEQRGAIWGGAAQNIGQTFARLPEQIAEGRRANTIDQMNQLRLGQAQRQQAGQQAVAGMMRGDQLPQGDTGPRQQSFLDESGLFDVGKITKALGQSGYGDMAPDLVRGAETINDSILKHQQLEQQITQAHTLMIGDMAAGALQMAKTGTPLLQAMDFVVQPALATKRIKPEEYAQVRQQIAGLPPEQQAAALKTFMDQASRMAPETTLSEGATRIDRYGRTTASGGAKPPTEAELALQAAGGDARLAMNLLKPAPKRTESEQELDAYAKSIGKPDAGALTYVDRQTFEKNKASITSNEAFQRHMRERQYDNANPAPEKAASQDKLEQEYRTVLARGLSSRSGGLGLEDAKVQQANHLLALLDQTFDPKTGEYSIPKVLQGELAAGLARLVAPGGNVGIEMMREFNQRTAKGDLAGALTYITGSPVSSATQDIAKMLKDSIERQGHVAQENREGEMAYLRNLAPTTLEESRRKALEDTSLNPLRMSRIIQNTATGERRVQVSTDGGKTWK